MRRNCNLELRLFPAYDSDHHRHHSMVEEGSEISPQHQCHHRQQQEQEQEQQKLTIFYDGKICVCDVTEFQARAILMLANKESELVLTPTAEASSPTSQHPLYSPTTGLSMKRSLQRFLQKRKNRLQEGSPYHH
ncbi:hypothetical protein L6164_035511 [Bauhinia variegata]|uniref:Uncharacterized protein n=1 Tax=Bauhinia variegata TaxID=167791 RepID=A0ACB9KEC2_BAUVA|nr:hypothetical protein L6164_035511 [Bauhinia variegata]